MSIMKKIYIKVLVACSVLFAFNSCALENEIYEDINPDVFPQNEEDIKAMLVANAYNVFSSDQYNGIFAVATGYQTCSDMVTDQAENSWVDGITVIIPTKPVTGIWMEMPEQPTEVRISMRTVFRQ